MTNLNTFDIAQETSELMRDEGTKLYVYDDANGKPIVKGYTVLGNPTIGTGRNLAYGSTGISMAENYLLLGNDIVNAEAILDADPMWSGWWRTLDPIRQRALINLCFNMGERTLDEFVNFCASMKEGSWAQAGADLKASAWWGEVGTRALRIYNMVVSDTLPADEPAPVPVADLPPGSTATS